MKTKNNFINMLLLSGIFSIGLAAISCEDKDSNEPVVFINYPSHGLIISDKDSINICAQLDPKQNKIESYMVMVRDSIGKPMYEHIQVVNSPGFQIYTINERFPNTVKVKSNSTVEVCATFDNGKYACVSNPFQILPVK